MFNVPGYVASKTYEMQYHKLANSFVSIFRDTFSDRRFSFFKAKRQREQLEKVNAY